MTPAPARPLTTLEFFVPGTLTNPLNGAHGHWRVAAAYRKTWREKVFAAARGAAYYRAVRPEEPKAITLTAYTWNVMDSHDGLRAALKPCVDGLVDAGLIDSDAPSAGHLFIYAQEIRRRGRGVRIRIELWAPRPAAGEEGR